MTTNPRTGLLIGVAGLIALVLAATVWSQAGVTRAQTPTPTPAERTITVSATGEANARPDQAIVRLGTQVETATAAEAQQQNASTINAVIEAVRAAGIPAENIQTTSVTLMPIHRDGPPEPRPEPSGPTTPEEPGIDAYRAGATIEITVDDVDRAGEIIDTAIGAGANTVQGIQFALQDPSTLQEQALRNAVANARPEAEALAAAIEVEITGTVNVIESGATGPPRPLAAPAAVRAESADQIQIEPGEQTVRATVSVTYTY